jgi:microcystin-dependent protein
MDPIMGTIILFAGNFAPKGWLFCDGSILSIAQNTALFSILGTTYGGNGTTTFALPDLRGRVPMQQGAGPGLLPRTLGETVGTETVTLLQTNLPAHTHTLLVSSNSANDDIPEGQALASGQFYDPAAPSVPLHPATVGVTGGSQPINNMQPSLALNYIIATEGVYPSRP